MLTRVEWLKIDVLCTIVDTGLKRFKATHDMPKLVSPPAGHDTGRSGQASPSHRWHLVVLDPQASRGGHLRQWGPGQIHTMECPAGIRVAVVVPPGVIDGVQSMGTIGAGR